VLACRVVETDEFARRCRRCGREGVPRDSVTGGWHTSRSGGPTTLQVTVRRYRCTGCGLVLREDISRR